MGYTVNIKLITYIGNISSEHRTYIISLNIKQINDFRFGAQTKFLVKVLKSSDNGHSEVSLFCKVI